MNMAQQYAVSVKQAFFAEELILRCSGVLLQQKYGYDDCMCAVVPEHTTAALTAMNPASAIGQGSQVALNYLHGHGHVNPSNLSSTDAQYVRFSIARTARDQGFTVFPLLFMILDAFLDDYDVHKPADVKASHPGKRDLYVSVIEFVSRFVVAQNAAAAADGKSNAHNEVILIESKSKTMKVEIVPRLFKVLLKIVGNKLYADASCVILEALTSYFSNAAQVVADKKESGAGTGTDSSVGTAKARGMVAEFKEKVATRKAKRHSQSGFVGYGG